MRLPDFARTSTFRWTLATAGAFVLCILLLFGFVYWQTSEYVTATLDYLNKAELDLLASESPDRRVASVAARLRNDPRRVRIAALFDSDGHPVTGNLETLPPNLVPDVPTNAMVTRTDERGRETQKVRLTARPLSDGETAVSGRNTDQIDEIASVVQRALALGLLPAVGLALGIGLMLSRRALDRISEVNRRIERIVAGDLRERLPVRTASDPFDRLALSVNGMLGEIEALIHEIAGVGDNIAHNLRTPLTRVRVRLDRGIEHATTLEELRAVAERSIAGLDQTLGIITALLRIAEIEHNRRLERFGEMPLAPLLREVGDLYEPIAEDKGVTLSVDAGRDATVQGDRDLLFEAVVNLVDNAVKFTPKGGLVTLALLGGDGDPVIRVSDTGIGIPECDRGTVTKRFFRSEGGRGTQGLGLGLSLVAAIVKLHGFRLDISGNPGCIVEIVCQRTP